MATIALVQIEKKHMRYLILLFLFAHHLGFADDTKMGSQLDTSKLLSFPHNGNYLFAVYDHRNSSKQSVNISFLPMDNLVLCKLKIFNEKEAVYSSFFRNPPTEDMSVIQSNLLTNSQTAVAATLFSRWWTQLKTRKKLIPGKSEIIAVNELAMATVTTHEPCKVEKMNGTRVTISGGKTTLVEACIAEKHSFPLRVSINDAQGKPRFSAALVGHASD